MQAAAYIGSRASCWPGTSVVCSTSDYAFIILCPSSCRHAFRLLQSVVVST